VTAARLLADRQGLSSADSLSLDAHKWLYQPLDCGCLLHRDATIARQTFSASADYVRIFNQSPGEAFAFFEESIETQSLNSSV
jgi:glutamate/tyrosine decarboxylase-like PLP-dependent enzyme